LILLGCLACVIEPPADWIPANRSLSLIEESRSYGTVTAECADPRFVWISILDLVEEDVPRWNDNLN